MLYFNIADYRYPGYGGTVAVCHLEVYVLEQIAVATEVSHNPGASVTNQAAVLATQVCRNFELEPRRFVFIEHYDARSYGDPLEKERYALVRFDWDGERFCNEQFVHLDAAAVKALLPTYGSP